MKILFISKPVHIEPLGLMYLSSVAKSLGHETRLEIVSEHLEKRVEDFNPDFIGYSIMTGDQNFYDEINKNLKKRINFFSVAGGPHPTFFPEVLESSSFDAICRGEGEKAFFQFLMNPKSLQTPNFWFKKENGEICRNSVSSLEENMDNIPFPDRKILSETSEIKDGPIKHFIATRGCPFNCAYCFNKSYSDLYEGKGNRVRFRSVDNLIEEIKQTISSSPTRFVYFQDDTFTLNKNWLEEFSEKYSKEIGMPFHCHVRANTINKEKVEVLKKAGCYSVHIAAETADDRLRNDILGRNMSKEQIIQACDILKNSGIKVMLQNIIGLPEGSLEKDLETLELNIRCNPDYSWVSIFQPYPGTRLGKFCQEKGYYTGNFGDLGDNFFDSSKLNFSEEYRNQLANLQKLFAVFVEFPELYKTGLLNPAINVSNESVKGNYEKIYREFRKIGDKRLYGFEL